MEDITPMLKQYQSVKARYPDCILFFRLGDFYEMFFEDARTASGILDLVLTARGAGRAGKVPMCGVPFHAADSYVSRLIKAGRKVAICEQLEDPSVAKGLVKRDVIRVVTSGTILDEQNADPRYLLSIVVKKNNAGIAFMDVTSGVISVQEYEGLERAVETVARLPVYEIVYPAAQEETVRELFRRPLFHGRPLTMSSFDDWPFDPEIAGRSLREHFKVGSLRGFGIEEMDLAVGGAGGLLEYLKQMNKRPMLHVDCIRLHAEGDFLFISPAACHGLELDDLFTAMDKTLTAMGRRLFRSWLFQPLKEIAAIRERQGAILLLKEQPSLRGALADILRTIPDVEKALSRISCGSASARDLFALRTTTALAPSFRDLLASAAGMNPLFVVDDLPEIREFLERSIAPDMPVTHPEGKIIRAGFHAELDSLRDIQENGREWLRNHQAGEIKRTGIHSLKIGFNKVFGYSIEISKANIPHVPPDYIRKQTLVNAERYITPALKEFEEKMVSAEEKVLRIEQELVAEIHAKILAHSRELHAYALALGRLDVLMSLTELSLRDGYVMPDVDEGTELVIREGRHPVVEKTTPDPFVPNDTLLDCAENHLVILTGPNMAGKSTYIRQTALLIILAQMGSAVPASAVRVGLVDRIFTRIGARDEISRGQSTFMVEMSETAGILNNLSERSLVILDEIGRGTSTFDGLSLAWAVAEELHKKNVRTLFATHFHELTALAEHHPGIKNFNVAVEEWKGTVVFLHKIVPGGTDESYGIHVAKLAGIPLPVIRRAGQILAQLEKEGALKERVFIRSGEKAEGSLFADRPEEEVREVREELAAAEEIRREIAALDLDVMTPLDALNKLHQLKGKT